ncbi:MAG: GDSL-type esterase/lipase family protein [Pseudomonadota bacterium]
MFRILSIVALVALGFLADIVSAPAHAQSFFDFFNERPQPRRYQQDRWSQPRGYYDEEDAWRAREYRRRARERREVSSASPKVKEVAKNADAKVILVIGDETSAGLAQGLREAFGADANARIESISKENASLLQSDGGGLPQLVKDKIEALKPSAVVIQVGTNDNKDISEAGKSIAFRSDEWNALYMQRLENLTQTLKGRVLPVYWVGLPAAPQQKTSSNIAYLNEQFRAKARLRGAKFVDIWEGFVDEDGSYIIIGPDVNGNKRRLRMRNGTTLTPAGNRKMAFYVEKELRRDVVYNSASPAAADLAAINQPVMNDPIIQDSYVGPVISLTPVATPVNGSTLLGDAKAAADASDVTGTLAANAAKPGRSDDFTWPLDHRKSLAVTRPNATQAKKEKRK